MFGQRAATWLDSVMTGSNHAADSPAGSPVAIHLPIGFNVGQLLVNAAMRTPDAPAITNMDAPSCVGRGPWPGLETAATGGRFAAAGPGRRPAVM